MKKTKIPQKLSNTQKLLINVTEVNKDSITSRQKLKGYFLVQDKLQTNNYIKDLEDTITINKQIISNLIADNKEKEPLKTIIQALNKENTKLQEKLMLTIKERDEFQAKLLIVEQIVEDYRGAEMNVEDRMRERIQEMLDQLSKKEYVVQSYEKKFHKLIPVLRKYIEIDPDIQDLVQALNIQIHTTQTITNVVEANRKLTTEVQTARVKVAELESKLAEIKRKDQFVIKESKSINMKPLSKITFHQSCNSTIDDAQKIAMENKILKQHINELNQEIELLKNGLGALQKKNEILCEELAGARKEAKKLRERVFELELNEKRKSEVFAEAKDIIDDDEIKLDDESFETSSAKVEDIIELINNK